MLLISSWSYSLGNPLFIAETAASKESVIDFRTSFGTCPLAKVDESNLFATTVVDYSLIDCTDIVFSIVKTVIGHFEMRRSES